MTERENTTEEFFDPANYGIPPPPLLHGVDPSDCQLDRVHS